MKNFNKIVLFTIVSVGICLLVYPYIFNKQEIKKAEAYYAPFIRACNTSTTTPTRIETDPATVASTTCIMKVDDLTNLDLNWAIKASTTATNLLWTAYFSYEDDEDTRNWYPAKGYTVISDETVNYGAGAVVNSLTPANSTASTTYHNVSLEKIWVPWVKIEYNLASTTGGNGEISLQIVGKGIQ